MMQCTQTKMFDKNLWTLFHCTGTKILDPWTLFQCTGTKIFGPCSSAQGRKFLDPVPVHRDENFWTLFQCAGTKTFWWLFKRQIFDPVSREVMERNNQSIVIPFATFVSRICICTIECKYWRSKCSFNIQHWLKYRILIDNGAIQFRRPSTIEWFNYVVDRQWNHNNITTIKTNNLRVAIYKLLLCVMFMHLLSFSLMQCQLAHSSIWWPLLSIPL